MNIEGWRIASALFIIPEEMKIGDRVKVARMTDYDLMVFRSQKIPLPIGKTGVVVDMGFSRSHGDIATVKMDDTGNRCIWSQKHLDILK